ncbi:hypothetical protein [Bacillus velezensis]|uniref:hypothetical protein n=1 Tax=Bacillus velezensis TaxID=492670 RepID=UPI00214869B9|nr:hypothetical protein [Bacillus velezensis]UUT18404.1 hypothetical protein NRF13_06130 [Bacillus velezensis]
MNEKLTKAQLEEIRQRTDAATEGPWRIGKQSPNGLNNIGTIGGLLTAQTTNEDDAKYIAHARKDIPALLDHIAEVEQELREATLIIDRVENLLSKMRHGTEYEVYGEVYRFLYGKDDEDDNV